MRKDSEIFSGIEAPLVFVYIGNNLPLYARDSLILAIKNWSGPVVLIADSFPWWIPKQVRRVRYRDWFSSAAFDEFATLSPLNPSFRGGFWHHTVMRFFVLAQFMETYGITRIMHAELDVAVLDMKGVSSELDAIGDGVFLPWVVKSHGVASILYCKSRKARESVLGEFLEHYELGHEMAMLGRILQRGNSAIFGLPSHGTLAREILSVQNGPNEILSSQSLGVFDGAPLGHWIFGEDPRNRPGKVVCNHYRFDYAPESEELLRVLPPIFSFSGEGLKLLRDHEAFPIRAIHVHSKAMYLVRWNLLFACHVWLANRSRSFPVLVFPKFVMPKWSLPGSTTNLVRALVYRTLRLFGKR